MKLWVVAVGGWGETAAGTVQMVTGGIVAAANEGEAIEAGLQSAREQVGEGYDLSASVAEIHPADLAAWLEELEPAAPVSPPAAGGPE